MIAAIAAAGLGAAAGGGKDKSDGFREGHTSETIKLQDFDTLNQGRSGLEALGYDTQMGQFQDLLKLLTAGPGEQEILQNNAFQGTFANQLQNLLSNVTNPSSQQTRANYRESQQLFAPQQEMLNQQFQDEQISSNRLAARLGRGGNDPVLRNKLMQEKTRQQRTLDSQVGSYAMQLPQMKAQQTMDIGGMLSNLRGGLASQALQNRQTLLSMGQQLSQSERNYRLSAANREGYQYQSYEDRSGGGFKGAVTGLFGGAKAGMSMMGGMQSMGYG
jgi:hypothetical protein